MTRTVNQARQAAAEADEYSNEALNELAGLRKRLADGDDTITAADLAAAKQEHERRALLSEGKHQAVHRAQIEQAQHELDTARSEERNAVGEWAALLGEHAPAVVEHLAALLSGVKRHNDTREDTALRGHRARRELAELEGTEYRQGYVGAGANQVKGDALVVELITAAYRQAGLLDRGNQPVRIYRGFAGHTDTTLNTLVSRQASRRPEVITSDVLGGAQS